MNIVCINPTYSKFELFCFLVLVLVDIIYFRSAGSAGEVCRRSAGSAGEVCRRGLPGGLPERIGADKISRSPLYPNIIITPYPD